MDLQNILQDERKKKFLIIGIIGLFVIVGIIFIFTRNTGSPSTNNQNNSGNNELLNYTFPTTPGSGVSTSTQSLVAPLVTVSADVPTVAPGQPSVISWDSTNATSCVDGNGNALRLKGSLSITPQENYTMDVVCTNPKGTTIQSVTVAVTTTPIITISASPATVTQGDKSIIAWTTLNTTRCVDGSGATLRLSGSVTVAPTKPYTFDITCTGPNGTDKKSVTVGTMAAGSSNGYVYVFKWKANTGANTPFQTSTFLTSAECQTAQKNSAGYEKTACIRVAVGAGTSTGGKSSADIAAQEAADQAAADAAAKAAADAAAKAAADAARKAAQDAAAKETNTSTGPNPPTIKITVAPLSDGRWVLGRGEKGSIAWEIKNATSCTLKNSNEVKLYGNRTVAVPARTISRIPDDSPMSGTMSVGISGVDASVIFEFNCSGDGGTTLQTKTLYWDTNSISMTAPPDVTLTVNPEAIAQASMGSFSEVSWSADNATNCTISADAYTELYVDEPVAGYVSILKSSAAPVTGTARIKPGYATSLAPYQPAHPTTCPSTGIGSIGTSEGFSIPQQETCTTPASGDGAPLCHSGNGMFAGISSGAPGCPTPTASVTISCKGPIESNGTTNPGGKLKSTVTKTVSITPTPPSGSGGGW